MKKKYQMQFYQELKKHLDDTWKDLNHVQMSDTDLIDAQQANTFQKPRSMRNGKLGCTDPSAHYHIGVRTSDYYNILSWLSENARDPVFKVCQVSLH